MPKINPDILRWARETAGLSMSEAAAKLQIGATKGFDPADRLAIIEAGAVEPTRPLLLKMATQYRRPLLTFYMAAPPATASRGEDFRTLPEEYARRDAALVDALLREVKARQEMVRSLLELDDEGNELSFVGSYIRRDGPAELAANIAKVLGFNLSQFRRGNGAGTPRGFRYLREKAEAVGVYVLLIGNLGSHHTALNVELFRGFALADKVAPFVVINDQDSEQAWSFTLLHELAHIWLGQTGVSGSKPSAEIEIFCNDVAGRILLPAEEIASEQGLRTASQAEVLRRIGLIAEAGQVSHSMVAYKLFREGMISQDMWQSVTAIFRQYWIASRQKVRDERPEDALGPSYYIVRRHRLGNRLIDLSRRMLAEGLLTPGKAAAILGVRPNNVYSLTAA